MVLAKEVHERHERVGELDGNFPCLLEAVSPEGDQYPHPMVELVLAVNVKAESALVIYAAYDYIKVYI